MDSTDLNVYIFQLPRVLNKKMNNKVSENIQNSKIALNQSNRSNMMYKNIAHNLTKFRGHFREFPKIGEMHDNQ